MGPCIPEIWLFQNLTMKIQGHGWGQRSRSHSWPCIYSTNMLFCLRQSVQSVIKWPMEWLTKKKNDRIALTCRSEGGGWGCIVDRQASSFTALHITVIVGTVAAWQRNWAKNKKSPGCPGWLNDTILLTIRLTKFHLWYHDIPFENYHHEIHTHTHIYISTVQFEDKIVCHLFWFLSKIFHKVQLPNKQLESMSAYSVLWLLMPWC